MNSQTKPKMEDSYIDYCWGPKFDKKAHSMKIKAKPWALTKEGSAREVKKDHEGPKAQKKEKDRKK